MVTMFIDDHKGRLGVEPICRVLSEHRVKIAPSTYYKTKAGERSGAASTRATRDDGLGVEIERAFHAPQLSRDLAGARKGWHLLRRDPTPADRFGSVVRCTVERLMRRAGLQGARRGRRFVTIRPDAAADRPPDLVGREFNAEAPNRLWIVEYTPSAADRLRHDRQRDEPALGVAE